MKSIQYFSVHACKLYGFPYIYTQLTDIEQAPDYESESVGMAELEKVLEFVKNDNYYSSFEEKCAYLISSIACSQYFSNGNKRLSVTVLVMFLIQNEAEVLDEILQLQQILATAFPAHVWEKVVSIKDPHSLFLYNLAIVLGDRKKWETDDFSEVRKKVATMFSVIHKRK